VHRQAEEEPIAELSATTTTPRAARLGDVQPKKTPLTDHENRVRNVDVQNAQMGAGGTDRDLAFKWPVVASSRWTGYCLAAFLCDPADPGSGGYVLRYGPGY